MHTRAAGGLRSAVTYYLEHGMHMDERVSCKKVMRNCESPAKTEMWGSDNDKQLLMGRRSFRKMISTNLLVPATLVSFMTNDTVYLFSTGMNNAAFFGLALIDSDKQLLWW